MALHETVSMIVEEEETLLTEHMTTLQENAELLSEEGRLLAQVHGNDVIDYDIDAYALRLEQVRLCGVCRCCLCGASDGCAAFSAADSAAQAGHHFTAAWPRHVVP